MATVAKFLLKLELFHFISELKLFPCSPAGANCSCHTDEISEGNHAFNKSQPLLHHFPEMSGKEEFKGLRLNSGAAMK